MRYPTKTAAALAVAMGLCAPPALAAEMWDMALACAATNYHSENATILPQAMSN